MGWTDRIIDVRSSIVPVSRETAQAAPAGGEQRYTLDQLSSMFSFGGTAYPFIAAAGSGSYDDVERDEHNFVDYVNSIYKSNGVIFGIVLARIQLFAEARFQFQRMRKGRPGDLYGNEELFLLEKPWPNGTTGELLARMEQDVSIGGNAYVVREAGRLRRLRPDWVQIILNEAPARAIKSDVLGYLYTPGGGTGRDEFNGKIYLPNEICHWSPIPDPQAQYRGMSWLTPVLSEIQADQATTRHKLKFFENAATPNLAVSFSESVTKSQFEGFMAAMNASHQGSGNAYKTLYLGGGADVKVIGADLRQLDFKSTQGAGETRICAAGGVPPIIVGLSEGLQSATYSNYGMARRKFGDHWARPQWRSVCSALERIITVPRDSRLWYDDRDIAFLREDQKDVAAIQSQQAGTMKQLLDAGYTPESVMLAVTNEDWTLLEHSGLYSVQLQPPGGAQAAPPGGELPAGPDSGVPAADGASGGGSGPNGEYTPEDVLAEAGLDVQTLSQQVAALQRQIEQLTERAADWDPKDHPRAPDGKFGTKGGGDGLFDGMDEIIGGQDVRFDFGTGEPDILLDRIFKTKGFDVKPKVLPEAEIERRHQNGERDYWRAYRQPDMADQLVEGDYYAGVGHAGNGTYFGTGKTDDEILNDLRSSYLDKGEKYEDLDAEGKQFVDRRVNFKLEFQDPMNSAWKMASEYGGSPSFGDRPTILRALIDPNAKTVDYRDLVKKQQTDMDLLNSQIDTETNPDRKELLSRRRDLIRDEGRYAALLGYDAVDIDEIGELYVLNRGVLQFSDERRGLYVDPD